MSILIKGMEMPKSCYKCNMRRRDGMDIVCPVAHERFSVADVNILEYRLDNCPLIPVPPHGRLGDLDAIMEHLEYLLKYCEPESQAAQRTREMMVEIMCAATIIPAEEGET